MTHVGRNNFLELANNVMKLHGSKRIKKDKVKDKQLMERLRDPRTVELSDVHKLLSLHLDAMLLKHGATVVENIKKNAIYLFHTNKKRISHNLDKLFEDSGPDNPVAACKCRTTGSTTDRAIRGHFDNDRPATANICIDARVALYEKNFCPQWGLHNGACGIVKEIIFAPGKDPNQGDLPSYVVVRFEQYCGPTWDMDDPKVRVLVGCIFG